MAATAEDTLDIQGASGVLKMHTQTVKKYAECGDIPGWRIGAQWRFSRKELERYLAGKKTS